MNENEVDKPLPPARDTMLLIDLCKTSLSCSSGNKRKDLVLEKSFLYNHIFLKYAKLNASPLED